MDASDLTKCPYCFGTGQIEYEEWESVYDYDTDEYVDVPTLEKAECDECEGSGYKSPNGKPLYTIKGLK